MSIGQERPLGNLPEPRCSRGQALKSFQRFKGHSLARVLQTPLSCPIEVGNSPHFTRLLDGKYVALAPYSAPYFHYNKPDLHAARDDFKSEFRWHQPILLNELVIYRPRHLLRSVVHFKWFIPPSRVAIYDYALEIYIASLIPRVLALLTLRVESNAVLGLPFYFALLL